MNESRVTRNPVWSRVRGVTSSVAFHVLVSALILVLVFLHPPLMFFGDTDTARNYLNTIISSLSTILALCISIILVAIQLTASNYTHRVLDFYMRLPYNGSLFLFYLVTIMHSFILMAVIRDPERDPLPATLARDMSADLVMVAICFVSLLLYMYAVVQLLKPERIIELVLRDYQRAYRRGNFRGALDNVEQLCDIAKRAASFSDSVTAMHCVEALLDIGKALPLPARRDDPMLTVHENLINQWMEILSVAVKDKETGLIYAVLDGLRVQGEHYIHHQAWQPSELVIRAYRHLTFSDFLADGHVFYADKVADRLYHLAHCAAAQGERGETFSVRTFDVIRMVGETTFRENPSAVASLLDGFLLSERFASTLAALHNPAQQEAGLILYFQLWKVFVSSAGRRDVARWAVWWEETMPPAQRRLGRELAVLLGVHEQAVDAVETICRIWHAHVADMDFAASEQAGQSHVLALFDGWSWPSVVARAKSFGAKDERPSGC
ncbi:DUF2254 family protein [Alicyclobacillus contaminans]|uniref:DUF2254 family protein n=1 Tax=Alicyclobacillus contaminans TaxID=392016 RepID=UPI00146F9487|nr:DUF2254 family protein [Alicyclobacillus contaminans]